MQKLFLVLSNIYEFISVEIVIAIFGVGFLLVVFRWVRKVNLFIFSHNMTPEDAVVWAEKMPDKKREAILDKFCNEEVTFKTDSTGRPIAVIRKQRKVYDSSKLKNKQARSFVAKLKKYLTFTK